MQKKSVGTFLFRTFKAVLFIVIFCRISFGMEVPPPDIAAGGAVHRRLMGIEIETSAIKVKETGEKLRIDFLYRDSEDLAWRIEEDTPDKIGELNNVEVKTAPTRGFGHEEIQEIGTEMELVLNSLYGRSQ